MSTRLYCVEYVSACICIMWLYKISPCNYILKNSIRESWKQATIISIPKPGKNNLYPLNYHPIALTSCLCKTMEGMVNKRLVWYIESNNLFTSSQCSLRNQRSTMDHVVRLETSIRDANTQKQHLIAIFSTWKRHMRPLGDIHIYQPIRSGRIWHKVNF